MRVVLDTNVLLSGMLTRGVCEALLDACVASESCTIVLCEHILDEFARHASGKFGAPDEKVEQAIAFLRRCAEIVEPVDLPREACRDADDLPILGAVIAGKADVLVTGDHDLLTLGAFQRVPILSPRQFYDRSQQR